MDEGVKLAGGASCPFFLLGTNTTSPGIFPQQNPTSERERVYRWLKRQFIHLTTATVSPTTALEITGDVEKQRCVAEAVAAVDPATATAPLLAAGRYQDSSFMSWDSARELLRRGPRCLKNSLAIDLPCLSKDLWMADLVDVGRTKLTSSFQSDERKLN